MRKLLLILLAVVCLLTLWGCKAQEEEQPDAETPKAELSEPYFTGKVLEKYENSFLAEVIAADSEGLAVGQQVVVNVNTLDCPKFAVGDLLTVAYDGKMTCSLPPQVVGTVIIRQNG